MTQIHRITVDTSICGGRPTIRGLRVRVKDVLDLLASVLEFAALGTFAPTIRHPQAPFDSGAT